MEVTFIQSGKACEGYYTVKLDQEALETLGKLESLRNELDCILLRRMILGILTMFKILFEDDHGKGKGMDQN